MIIRKRYDEKYNPLNYGFATEGESRTQQQFKKECDVNHILEKYKKTNMITHVNKSQGVYGNFADSTDYMTSLHKIQEANDSFMALSSTIRSKFENDPAKLIDYLKDPKNREEAQKLGMLKTQTKEPTIQEQMEQALENNDTKRQKSTKSDKN